MSTSNLQVRANAAARRFLESEECMTILDDDELFDVVAKDMDGDIHFIKVDVCETGEDGLPDEIINEKVRKENEIRAAQWLSLHCDGEPCSILFDICSLCVVGDKKALLRYHSNAFLNNK